MFDQIDKMIGEGADDEALEIYLEKIKKRPSQNEDHLLEQEEV